jgi:hypothetical protein
MAFDVSWVAVVFLALAWFCALPVYGPAQPWLAPYAVAALALASVPFRRAAAKAPPLRMAAAGAAQCAAALLAQAAAFPFLYTLFAKYHASPLAARIGASALGAAGVRAAAYGNLIRIEAALKPVEFAATWEKLGL